MRLAAALVFLLAVALASESVAQTAAAPRQALEAMFAPGAGQPIINGGVLATQEGRVVFRAALGFADAQAQRRLHENSVFQTASMSKPFTSTAILQLRDRGLLRLDDPAPAHLPGFPYPDITLRHLLTHTSGLPDLELFEDLIAADPQHVVSGDDLIPALNAWRQPLAFPPGAQFRYSNVNYQLLARIVEVTSGQRFGAYVRDHIFRSANMRASYVLGTPAIGTTRPPVTNHIYATMFETAPRDVRGVETGDARRMARLRYETFNLGSTLGDQNVFTTLADLRRFDDALRSGRVLSQESQAEAYAPVQLNDGTTYLENEIYQIYGARCSYGMGWETCVHPQFGRIAGHAGFNHGAAAILYRNLDHDQLIAMYDNADSSDFAAKAASVANLMNGAPAIAFSTQRSLTRAYGRLLIEAGPATALAFFNQHRAETDAWAFTPRGLNQLGYDLRKL